MEESSIKYLSETIKLAYAQRDTLDVDKKYSLLIPNYLLEMQVRQRVFVYFYNRYIKKNLNDLKLLEVGFGKGDNLLQLIQLGLLPKNIYGIELIDERYNIAKSRLDSSVNLYLGNALEIKYPKHSFDIILLSTVFTSITDLSAKIKLAQLLWSKLSPGGGIMWYDFKYNNPFNKNVKGIPKKEIKLLFPEGKIFSRKLTIAPPLARMLKINNSFLYDSLSMLKFLTTHLACYITKLDKND